MREATKQIAFVVSRRAGKCRARPANTNVSQQKRTSLQLRGEALLLAGDLHEQAKNVERALAVYQRYVKEFPRPIDVGSGDATQDCGNLQVEA